MNSETIDLIATDPPFNKGRDFHATPDSLAAGAKFQDRWSWADDVEGEWVDKITDDWPAVQAVIEAARTTYGEDMAAFLCFMGVRLIEMHRILKATGSLYLHCDPHGIPLSQGTARCDFLASAISAMRLSGAMREAAFRVGTFRVSTITFCDTQRAQITPTIPYTGRIQKEPDSVDGHRSRVSISRLG